MIAGHADLDHCVVDEWRDCVLVCSCGWRTAARTKTEARKEWLEHVARHKGVSQMDHAEIVARAAQQIHNPECVSDPCRCPTVGLGPVQMAEARSVAAQRLATKWQLKNDALRAENLRLRAELNHARFPEQFLAEP